MLEYRSEQQTRWRYRQQTESYHDKSHHGTAAEGNRSIPCQVLSVLRWQYEPSIGSRLHTEKPGQSAEETTRKECGTKPTGFCNFQYVSHEGEDDGEHHKDDGHHLVLLLLEDKPSHLFFTCAAISFILSVPSSPSDHRRKKNHAIPNATTLAIGMSQNTNGMLFITV